MERYKTLGATTLNGALDASQTNVIVTSAAGLRDSFATGDTYRIRVENEIMKVTAESTNTLTVVRAQEGTTGATHADTTAVTQVITSAAVEQIKLDANGARIQGFALGWSSTTAITVAAGILSINGKFLSYAGATLTGGSTLLKMDGTAYTLAASKCVHVYAYDNAGTLQIRTQEWATSGDTPTFDAALDYHKNPAAGAVSRRIGKFWTNASSQIIAFDMAVYGRLRKTKAREQGSIFSFVVAGTATTYTSMTITPYVTGDDAEILLFMTVGMTSGSGTAQVSISTDGGTSGAIYYTPAGAISDTGAHYMGADAVIFNSGTLHYKVAATNTGGVFFDGVNQSV